MDARLEIAVRLLAPNPKLEIIDALNWADRIIEVHESTKMKANPANALKLLVRWDSDKKSITLHHGSLVKYIPRSYGNSAPEVEDQIARSIEIFFETYPQLRDSQVVVDFKSFEKH